MANINRAITLGASLGAFRCGKRRSNILRSEKLFVPCVDAGGPEKIGWADGDGGDGIGARSWWPASSLLLSTQIVQAASE
jgi:hypothetical protein